MANAERPPDEPGATPGGGALARGWLENSPFVTRLGIRLEDMEPDRVRLAMPFSDWLPTIGEVVHGGAIGALIDTAAMAAAWATDEVPESPAGSTVSLSVNFASAASGVDLRAEARVAKRGGRLSFCEVSVTDPNGTVVAHGIATYRFG